MLLLGACSRCCLRCSQEWRSHRKRSWWVACTSDGIDQPDCLTLERAAAKRWPNCVYQFLLPLVPLEVPLDMCSDAASAFQPLGAERCLHWQRYATVKAPGTSLEQRLHSFLLAQSKVALTRGMQRCAKARTQERGHAGNVPSGGQAQGLDYRYGRACCQMGRVCVG